MAWGPCAAMTAVNRSWTMSSASDHEIRSKRPSPLAPARLSGVLMRPSPWTKPGYAWGTFAQSTPAVYGLAREPRIETIRSSSTVTVRLQVSGQSSGQTLGCSVLIRDLPAATGSRQPIAPACDVHGVVGRGKSHCARRREGQWALWRGWQGRHVVREALDVRLAERLRRGGHGAVEIAGRLRLEPSQELHQIGHILTGQSRNLLVSDEAGPMAGDTVVLLG